MAEQKTPAEIATAVIGDWMADLSDERTIADMIAQAIEADRAQQAAVMAITPRFGGDGVPEREGAALAIAWALHGITTPEKEEE